MNGLGGRAAVDGVNPSRRRHRHAWRHAAGIVLTALLAAADVGAELKSAPRRGFAPRSAPARASAAVPPSMTSEESAIRITAAAPQAHPSLDAAYAALGRDELDEADGIYRRVVADDPVNGDALNGLAVIALRRGQRASAIDYTQRAIDADPGDAGAQARLTDLRGHGNRTQAEGRIKGLLAVQPEQPALQFALGNLYAAASRWHEARSAYDAAVRLDPDNPDYRHNLAVSLDRIRQPTAAAHHYRAALAGAARQAAAFDIAAAAARLRRIAP